MGSIAKETCGIGLGTPANIDDKGLAKGNPLSYFLKEPELELESASAVITPNTSPLAKTLTYKPIIDRPTLAHQEFESGSASTSTEPVHEDTWNLDSDFQEDLWSKVMAAKQERREELLSLERKRAELDQQKRLVEQAQQDIQIRENRLIELEPLIPSAATLQGYGIKLELIFPYMKTINEKAVAENIDLKTAAYNLAQDLRDYRQLEEV